MYVDQLYHRLSNIYFLHFLRHSLLLLRPHRSIKSYTTDTVSKRNVTRNHESCNFPTMHQIKNKKSKITLDEWFCHPQFGNHRPKVTFKGNTFQLETTPRQMAVSCKNEQLWQRRHWEIRNNKTFSHWFKTVSVSVDSTLLPLQTDLGSMCVDKTYVCEEKKQAG